MNLPSLRTLLTLALVLPVVFVTTFLTGLSVVTSRHVAESLATSLVEAASNRTTEEITNFLSAAVRVSDLYAFRMETGRLSAADLGAWNTVLLEDLRTSPRVASICFGTGEGAAIWMLRDGGRLETGHARAGQNEEVSEFEIGPDGKPGEKPLRIYHYDPRERPWYKAAATNDGPLWTPIYLWFGASGDAGAIGTGYARSIHDHSGKFLGVLVVDVSLEQITSYLKGLALTGKGRVTILDEQDKMVASSSGNVVGKDGERLKIGDATTEAGHWAASALAALGDDSETNDSLIRFQSDGTWLRAKVTTVSPYRGLRWRVVTTLPESVFLDEVNRTRLQSLFIAGTTILLSLGLALWLSNRISGPLLKLTAQVRGISDGDFEAKPLLGSARELSEVSKELNSMASGLKQRLELERAMEIATKVQQSLLPACDPVLAGMDIAGRSRYCETTGGDYFDFVDISPLGPDSPLIAVGDVMGHGIGSALLMASARAALRAHATSVRSLGELMRCVNQVLSADARHDRFMTLFLLVIEQPNDSGTRSLRWASAGHDPMIIYKKHTDLFEEPEGGGLPLGIERDVPYEEYRLGELSNEDVLVVGTDGIWEMRDNKKEFFGKQRLKEIIKANAAKFAAEIGAEIERSLAEFRGDRTPQDDVTFVVAKSTGASPF